MIQWRAKTNLDDSLDVVAAHGVGGTVGALLTGVFAQKAMNGVAKVIGVVFELRANDGDQATGMDVSMHGEEAYVHTGGMGSPEALA